MLHPLLASATITMPLQRVSWPLLLSLTSCQQSKTKISNKQATLLIFLLVASSLTSPWLCLSFAVAVSLSPQNPKSLYVKDTTDKVVDGYLITD
ncbi:hypothetical protein CR513_11860, partial [Mucuna pruriens]